MQEKENVENCQRNELSRYNPNNTGGCFNLQQGGAEITFRARYSTRDRSVIVQKTFLAVDWTLIIAWL